MHRKEFNEVRATAELRRPMLPAVAKGAEHEITHVGGGAWGSILSHVIDVLEDFQRTSMRKE